MPAEGGPEVKNWRLAAPAGVIVYHPGAPSGAILMKGGLYQL